MMSKLVPKLRFDGFSGEWEEKRLSDISEKISYGLTIRPEYIDFGIPLISAKELRDGSINYEIASKISQKSYDKLSDKAKGQRGDIFLSKTGTIGLIGYVDVDFPIAITQNIAIVRVDNTVYSHSFILQTFKTKKFYKMALAKVNQSTIMDLQLQDIRKLSILIPEIEEQQKIASCLSSLDSLIEAQNKKVEALKKHKKGLMQQLFPKEGERVPTLRFDGFSGEWEEKDFEKIFNRIASKKYQIKSDEYLERGKYPVIDQGKSKIIAYSNDKGKLFINDNIILFGDHTRILKYIDFNFIVGADGTQLIKAREGYNNKFLYYQLLKNKIPNTGYNRHFKFIKDMSFFVPKQKEQQKIASCLSSLDSLIEANEQKVKALKKHKKGLMQQMFVGGDV